MEFPYKNNMVVIKAVDKKAIFKVGFKVYGPDLRAIGKAIDVLGPIDEPRVLVRLFTPAAKLRENSKMYYEPKELRGGARSK